MTGLPNRLLLLDRLAHARAASRRSGRGFAVLCVGLDGFDLVNDAYGYGTGDVVLRLVGERLRQVVRPGDTVARLGGDEFALLCVELPDEAAATEIAARALRCLREPLTMDRAEVVVTGSVGVAMGDVQGDVEHLLRDASAAVSRAKQAGRNRYAVFGRELRGRGAERLELTAGLARVLADGGIGVHYQAIVDLSTGRPVGAEALARWWRGHGAPVSPALFVEAAEKGGLIDALGSQVLEKACRDAGRWLATPDLMLSVNVSPRQLMSDTLVDEVGRVLELTGIAPASLHLEVTESTMISEPVVQAVMKRLRGLGVRFAIDDFGTGYSSLAMLRELPVDVLKIDRRFVGGVTFDRKDRALVVAAVELARAFELVTIAEGVETEAQRDELAFLGCDLAQGFLWGRPGPAETLDAVLAAR